MANPAPTINQINAFNATQGTTIDFNIIGGTELVRSNKIYIYDLSDNSLICTHLYTSTESIHELPANTNGSIVYESGKSSADFVNGKQYYAQIQTFTDIAGTQGGSGLSVSKLFWCLVDPSLTIDTIPSSISTTSYNVSATYDANTSVVSNIIQQYQFSLYSATGSLLQSSGVVVGNGEQQGTSTAYDISYNFSGLSVGSSYYVTVDVTTTQGMSISAQSSTFTVSIDTPTLGEATVVNNACDGYISVTSNLSGEYGGSASGEIATFETDSVNNVTKLEVELEPTQLGSGTPSPSNVRPIVGHSEVEAKIVGKNLCYKSTLNYAVGLDGNGVKYFNAGAGTVLYAKLVAGQTYCVSGATLNRVVCAWFGGDEPEVNEHTENFIYADNHSSYLSFTATWSGVYAIYINNGNVDTSTAQVELGSTPSAFEPYKDPTEVSESFNVILTPTVIDETPYLFKKTGDVRGDRESLELVGGTVNWNQLLDNVANLTLLSDYSTITKNNTDNSFTLSWSVTNNLYTYALFQNLEPIKNHVYVIGGFVELVSGVAPRIIWGKASNKDSTPNTPFVNKSLHFIMSKAVDVVGGVPIIGATWNNSDIGQESALKFKNCVLIDITAFFCNSTTADYVYSLEQANAGAGIAWLRKYFPDLFAYSSHNAGTLESVKPTAHVTRGVNQWDEETELGGIGSSNGVPYSSNSSLRSKNFCCCVGGQTYYFKGTFACYWYDENQGFIKTDYVGNNTKVAPTNARYFKIALYEAYGTTYNHDICINISNADINGQYFPYESHTYPITELELRGIPKLVDGELRFDGDTRKADGSVDRRYASVTVTSDMVDGVGTASTGVKYATVTMASAGKDSLNGMSVGYEKVSAAPSTDKKFRTVSNIIYVYDNMFTDIATAKSTLNGKTFVYELATPTTETADPFTDPQEVSIYGTEEFVSSNGVPVGNKTTYKTRDIFGGTIDLASGVLTVDRAGILFDGTENWLASSNANRYYLDLPPADFPFKWSNDVTAESNYYEWWHASTSSSYLPNEQFMFYYASAFAYREIIVRNDAIATLAAWKSWLNSHNLFVLYDLNEPQTYQLTPHEIETLIGTNNVWSNAGDVLIEFNIPITNLLVKRQDVDDVSGNWLTLYSQPVEQASDMDFTFIDFLNQYGKTYKYALVPLLTQIQSGVEVEVEGGYTVSDEVQSIFDGVYIGDSTGVQRLKAGVAYNNLNTNQQVGVIPTLGNKYPVIVSNGNIQYDTGSVSGLIVPDDFYSNGNLSRLDMSDKRGVINDFLTNKKPKILKDWNGNIWLVVFTDNVDVSFDNNYGMGIATFTSGWTEVGDPTNQEDLQKTGLINVGGD